MQTLRLPLFFVGYFIKPYVCYFMKRFNFVERGANVGFVEQGA